MVSLCHSEFIVKDSQQTTLVSRLINFARLLFDFVWKWMHQWTTAAVTICSVRVSLIVFQRDSSVLTCECFIYTLAIFPMNNPYLSFIYIIIETTQSDVELYEVCDALDVCQTRAWTDSDVLPGDGAVNKNESGKLATHLAWNYTHYSLVLNILLASQNKICRNLALIIFDVRV
jgi:hypothetical protein